MAREIKHVGKMKNNNAKVVVAYRTVPGEHLNALVIGTNNLGDSYHDALMNLIQDNSGQSANELADVLSTRSFPDGSNMLQWFHGRGHLKKVPTHMVIMTPTPQASIPLDELNQIIADQKGITVEELAMTESGKTNTPRTANSRKDDPTKTTSSSVNQTEVIQEEMTPTQLRSKADALFKQAQVLRKQADEIDPPKKKKKEIVSEEA